MPKTVYRISYDIKLSGEDVIPNFAEADVITSGDAVDAIRILCNDVRKRTWGVKKQKTERVYIQAIERVSTDVLA